MKTNKTRRQFFQTTGLLAAAGLTARLATGDDPVGSETVTVPSRNEINRADTWDLGSLFPDDDAWQKTFDTVKDRLDEFTSFQGRLRDAATIFECFLRSDAVGMDLERIAVYAYLRYSEDVADPQAQEMKGKSDSLLARYNEKISFMRPELLAIDELKWKAIVADKQLDPYRLKLERIARQRPHTLSKNEERLLAMMTEVSQTASKAFNLLNNADLKFGTVRDEQGRNLELSTGSFIVLMNSPDRTIRKKAFDLFYAGYESHENTLASLLGSSVQKDVFQAKARNHAGALESALFYEEIPCVVYDNLIETVNAALPTLHRYYELRRRKMGIDTIHMYDTYIPILSDIKTDYPWDKAVRTVCEAVHVLGDDYVETMRAGLTSERWCDRYENKGKRSGAFSYGSYTAKPYILMNYKPSVIDGLFTLAHEAGHSMHTWYSARSQSFAYYDYVTFVAEVASTFNEDLLARHLMSHTTDNRMKAWLVNRQIDAIRQTLFRQTMFAEFEQRTHEAVESGRSLTVKSIREIYRGLLNAYFGPKFTIDDALEVECLRVPHFYRAFYVYKYATGISAALALAQRVSSGGEKERDEYLTFLHGGSSATPIELLRLAGVDMLSPQPIEAAMRRFKELVDELEQLI